MLQDWTAVYVLLLLLVCKVSLLVFTVVVFTFFRTYPFLLSWQDAYCPSMKFLTGTQ